MNQVIRTPEPPLFMAVLPSQQMGDSSFPTRQVGNLRLREGTCAPKFAELVRTESQPLKLHQPTHLFPSFLCLLGKPGGRLGGPRLLIWSLLGLSSLHVTFGPLGLGFQLRNGSEGSPGWSAEGGSFQELSATPHPPDKKERLVLPSLGAANANPYSRNLAWLVSWAQSQCLPNQGSMSAAALRAEGKCATQLPRAGVFVPPTCWTLLLKHSGSQSYSRYILRHLSHLWSPCVPSQMLQLRLGQAGEEVSSGWGWLSQLSVPE